MDFMKEKEKAVKMKKSKAIFKFKNAQVSKEFAFRRKDDPLL